MHVPGEGNRERGDVVTDMMHPCHLTFTSEERGKVRREEEKGQVVQGGECRNPGLESLGFQEIRKRFIKTGLEDRAGESVDLITWVRGQWGQLSV